MQVQVELRTCHASLMLGPLLTTAGNDPRNKYPAIRHAFQSCSQTSRTLSQFFWKLLSPKEPLLEGSRKKDPNETEIEMRILNARGQS